MAKQQGLRDIEAINNDYEAEDEIEPEDEEEEEDYEQPARPVRPMASTVPMPTAAPRSRVVVPPAPMPVRPSAAPRSAPQRVVRGGKQWAQLNRYIKPAPKNYAAGLTWGEQVKAIKERVKKQETQHKRFWANLVMLFFTIVLMWITGFISFVLSALVAGVQFAVNNPFLLALGTIFLAFVYIGISLYETFYFKYAFTTIGRLRRLSRAKAWGKFWGVVGIFSIVTVVWILLVGWDTGGIYVSMNAYIPGHAFPFFNQIYLAPGAPSTEWVLRIYALGAAFGAEPLTRYYYMQCLIAVNLVEEEEDEYCHDCGRLFRKGDEIQELSDGTARAFVHVACPQ
jgi:hypothetical protein